MALSEYADKSENTSITWSIIAADWRDYTQVSSLEKTAFQADDVWPFWDLIGVLTLPGLIRYKAVMDGCIVGFIGGEREATRQIGWVTTLAILPEYRRRGIALDLLNVCEQAMRTPLIRLSVRASNQPAIGLYTRAGYKMVDRWKKYYVGGEDALVFQKKC